MYFKIRTVKNLGDIAFHHRCNLNSNITSRRSVLYLVMEGGDLVGEQAVFVHQETKASLLLQQRLLTAVCNEQLHVHLTACQRFQALTKKHYNNIIHYNNKRILFKWIRLPFVIHCPTN